MESMPRRVTNWLNVNYPNERTRFNYYHSLRLWITFIYGENSVVILKDQIYRSHREKLKGDKEKRIKKVEEGIERYFSDLDKRDFLNDYKGFIRWMLKNENASLTIRNRCATNKYFFERQKDKRCKIDKDDWAQIKNTLLPKSTRPSTKDQILTKEQLMTILPHLSIHGKAMTLFLLSTGARIGESCQLRMSDIHLDDDPPWIDILEKYTKGKVGGRKMWMSFEASDAIKDWHFTRTKIDKAGPNAGPYDKDSALNYTPKSFNDHWNRALVLADRGADPPVLAKRDNSTKRRVHVFHTHTLRKFFRTNMGVKGTYEGKSGVQDMVVHAWMGHRKYLETYDKLGDEMSEIYKENMNVVTVREDAGEIRVDEVLLDGIAEELDAFVGLSEEDILELSVKEKWTLIKVKVAKRKEEKKVPVDELDVDVEEYDEVMDFLKKSSAHSITPKTQSR